jgi:hypothetical protein
MPASNDWFLITPAGPTSSAGYGGAQPQEVTMLNIRHTGQGLINLLAHQPIDLCGGSLPSMLCSGTNNVWSCANRTMPDAPKVGSRATALFETSTTRFCSFLRPRWSCPGVYLPENDR